MNVYHAGGNADIRESAVCKSFAARHATLCIVAGALAAAGCVTASAPVRPAPSGDAATSVAEPRGGRGPHDSLDDFAESHFSADAWRDDVGHGYFRSSAVWLPIGLGLGAAAVAPWDHKIDDHLSGTSTTLGNVTLGALLAGTAAVGLFAPGEGRAGAEERWNIVEALVATVATTQALNVIVRRVRPNDEDHSSFPSGHASTAFACATLIDRNSGHAWGIPAYALATATAVSRVASRKHFPSDVLFGAALGVLSASVVDALHFGVDDKSGGISRRRMHAQLGLDTDANGRPVLALTLSF